MPNNPYIAGNPVGKTQAFIGREDVLREVVRIIKNPSQNAIALYGQRRIGKTSILQYLTMHLPQEGAYKPVYFDLQDKAAMPLARVLEELARTIAFACGYPEPKLGKDTETTFRSKWLPELLQSLTKKEKLVLLFDEFDILADPRGDQAVKAFFPYLRSLLELDLEHLDFIFVLGRRIDDLDSIALSVFKGISAYRVSLLTRKDTELLARIAERNESLYWTDDAVACLWELTHGHPYLTQQVCSQVWDLLYADAPEIIPEVTKRQVEDSIQKTLDTSRNALEWLWNGLPPAERVVISALAEAGSGIISQDRLEEVLHNSGVRVLIRELRDAPELLTEWDLIESDKDGRGYIFRVELLRRWLASNKPLRRVQDELDRLTPVADGLYQAAQGMYTQGNLDGALGLLRQAVAQNPNHLRANELLSEILITQNEWDEARKLLEHLYEINPSVARSRLAQVLMVQADDVRDEAERLKMYDRILELEPRRYANLREAADKIRFELRSRELATSLAEMKQLQGENRYEEARMFVEKLSKDYPEHQDWEEIRTMVRLSEFAYLFGDLKRLQNEKQYDEAKTLAEKLSVDFPEQQDWPELLFRLEKLSRISEIYQRALGALNSGDLVTAIRLFAEVVSLDPEYELASNYLNKVVRGVDALELHSQYESTARRYLFARRLIIGGMIVTALMLFGWGVTGWQYIEIQRTATSIFTWAAPAMAAATQTELAENIAPPIGELIKALTGHTGSVTSIAFSPDGTMLATGSSDPTDQTVRLWNVSDGQLIWERHTLSVKNVAFSPDGKILATLSGYIVVLWNVADGKSILTLGEPAGDVTNMVFLTDGTILATGLTEQARTRITRWNSSDGRYLGLLSVPIGGVKSIAVSSDGTMLAAGFSDNTARLWNVLDSSFVLSYAFSGHTDEVTSIAFSPDGTMLATGSSDQTVRLWNVSDGKLITIGEGHTGSVTSIAFSPDGTMLATGSSDQTVRLWNVSDNKLVTAGEEHIGGVTSVAFSPDGTILATTGDPIVHIWRIK